MFWATGHCFDNTVTLRSSTWQNQTVHFLNGLFWSIGIMFRTFTFVDVFLNTHVLTWSITRQGYPLSLWKTCFRFLSSFSSSVSFEHSSLSFSFEHTSVVVFRSIRVCYWHEIEDHEITTIFTKSEMKKVLTLCTKNVHFWFNNQIYIQIDGLAMGSPLGPVIANIFIVELETNLVPRLEDHVQKCRRFVDDTFAYVKIGSVEYVLSVLNSFHKNIKFTYEVE